MTARNRLLYFKHLRTGSLEFEQDAPTLLNGLKRRGGSDGWGFYLPPDPDAATTVQPGPRSHQAFPSDIRTRDASPPRPRRDELIVSARQDKTAAQITRSLSSLSRKSRAELLDAGLWVLYLGLGFLHWREGQANARSPLYLLPVGLHRRRGEDTWRLTRSEEGEPALNPSLAVKLEKDLDIRLPSLDDLDDDSYEVAMDAVRGAVRNTAFRVDETAVLCTFTFHKEVIYRDLRANEEAIVRHPMVRLLAEGPSSDQREAISFEPEAESGLDERHPPEDLACILDADATQRRCLIAARQGHSFVMDGPPGTGKSQTIANVIAQLLYDGKTVLFVSEKAAALDVVHNRLEGEGLHHFTLELHSHKATRRAVALDLGEALGNIPQANSGFSPADRASIERRRRELSGYAAAVNEVRKPSQQSLHDVIGEISKLDGYEAVSLPGVDALGLRPEARERLEHHAHRLAQAWAPVARGEDFLWRDLSIQAATSSLETDGRGRVRALRDALGRLEGVSKLVHEDLWIAEQPTPDRAEWLLGLVRLAVARPPVAPAWLTSTELSSVGSSVNELADVSGRLASTEAKLDSAVHNWRSLDTAASDRAERLLADLRGARPPVGNVADCYETDLRALGSAASKARSSASAARPLVALVGEALGTGPLDGVSLSLLDHLVELGGLATVDPLPEPSWLDAEGVQAASEALAVLSRLVARFGEQRNELMVDFKPSALELDLEGLKERFDNVHTGLRKLGGAYRSDKAILAASTISGKVTKDTVARLAQLVALQKALRELEAAEAAHSAILGACYRGPESTDFEQAQLAVESAERVLEVTRRAAAAGVPTSRRLIAALLGRSGSAGANSRRHVADTADKIAVLLDAIRGGELASWAGVSVLALEQMGLAAFEDGLRIIEGGSAGLADEVAAVDHLAGSSMQVATALRWLRVCVHHKELALWVESRADSLRPWIGGLADAPDGESLRAAREWVDRVRACFGGEIESRTADLILACSFDESLMAARVDEVRQARKRLLDLFENPHRNSLSEDLNHSYRTADELLDSLEGTVADMRVWFEYVDSRRELEAAGLGPAVDACIGSRKSATEVEPTLKLSVMRRWADQVIDSDSRLQPYQAAGRDRASAIFQSLDRHLIRHTAANVINACAGRRPKLAAGGAAVIRQQAQLKKRHKPVRVLLTEAGDAAQRLKPCFMMSPLSVSQFLPADLAFDAVIFDEASQVREADAIGCIYRGRQLIVAGDEKQLPPTSFFDRMADTDEEDLDEVEILGFESVLDRCKAQGFSSLPLRWHYRSRHEDLITYSNYSFYEGRLHTFPSAVHEAADLGVELISVDGTYRRGTTRDNPKEAEAVVDRVLHHRRHSPEATIGVVALSTAQQEAVETEIERRAAEMPELYDLITDDRLSGFFVKNLETVQGDERDIIILTIGYGRDENGRLTMNFGPMNREGGERRLNVAVTRARRRVEVVSSISSGDVRADNPSLAHLQRYLDFAERGRAALAISLEHSLGDTESPFEEDVLRAVRSLGYVAVPQVGAAGYRIDIGVRHPRKPGAYVLGVECDGASYHSSKVARDRDRLRQEVLEGLGWTIHRIWSTAWFNDRAGEVDRLDSAVSHAIDGPRPSTTTAPPAPSRRGSGWSTNEQTHEPKVVVTPTDLDARPDWAVDYVEPVAPPIPSPRPDFHDLEAREILASQIREIVGRHAPIHHEAVLKAIRKEWGLHRAGQRMRDSFTTAVRMSAWRRDIEQDGVWLYSLSRHTVVRVPAGPDAPRRPVDEVPPDEIELALKQMLRDAGTMSRVELRATWARLYGWQRVGADIDDAFKRATEALIGAEKVHGPDPLRLAD